MLENKDQVPQCGKAAVMRGYFGLDFDFKLTAKNGDVLFLSNNQNDLLALSKLDLEQFKMQQFTGILDSNKTKIYFGDTLRFADKWEWYRGTWSWNFMGTNGEEREKLQKEYDELPFLKIFCFICFLRKISCTFVE